MDGWTHWELTLCVCVCVCVGVGLVCVCVCVCVCARGAYVIHSRQLTPTLISVMIWKSVMRDASGSSEGDFPAFFFPSVLS